MSRKRSKNGILCYLHEFQVAFHTLGVRLTPITAVRLTPKTCRETFGGHFVAKALETTMFEEVYG